MSDEKVKVKRTYFITDEIDVAVKVRAAKDHVHPSDVIQTALEEYLDLKKEK